MRSLGDRDKIGLLECDTLGPFGQNRLCLDLGLGTETIESLRDSHFHSGRIVGVSTPHDYPAGWQLRDGNTIVTVHKQDPSRVELRREPREFLGLAAKALDDPTELTETKRGSDHNRREENHLRIFQALTSFSVFLGRDSLAYATQYIKKFKNYNPVSDANRIKTQKSRMNPAFRGITYNLLLTAYN